MQARASIEERLAALAMSCLTQAENTRATVRQHAEFLQNQVALLTGIAGDLEEEYVRLTVGEVPTCAQGLALARFLRPAFRARTGAYVCRAGLGLPEDYLHVRLADGYEGGIAPDGATTT